MSIEITRPAFAESSNRAWSSERERLLEARVNELGLTIEGSRLQPLVAQLYSELDEHGISLRPPVFLSDEWGCPEGVPAIGVPFYLADARLSMLEKEVMETIEAESDAEIAAYLRHECGHAFNYAHRLYDTEAWHDMFGPYSRPYRELYEPNPFSRSFVRHISGWYAQKHPDEDFAETFAVWLTPGLDWRADYEGWGCLPKLEYVERIVAQLGRNEPLVSAAYDDSQELAYTLSEYHHRNAYRATEVPSYFDGDLRELFEDGAMPQGALPAEAFLLELRRPLVHDIGYWTGLHESIVRSLVEHFASRAAALGLWLHASERDRLALRVTTYTTTLAMNRLYKGDFVIK